MVQLLKNLFMIEVLLVVGILLCRHIFSGRAVQIVTPKLIAITLVTPVVGMFCGNVQIFYAYLACLVAFNSRDRTELATIYVAVMPMVPALVVETEVFGVYLAAFSTILAMNFGALIGALTTASKPLRRSAIYDIAIGAVILIFLYIYGRESSVTAIIRGVALNAVSFLGPYLLISRAMDRRGDIDALILRLLYGATLCCVVAVFQSVRHWVVYQYLYSAMNVPLPSTSWTAAIRSGLLRTGGSMLDYTGAGVFLAGVVCLLPFVRTSFKPSRFWLLTAILLAGLFATQSRGGWVAAFVGFVVVLALRRRYAIAAAVAAVLGGAELLVITFAKTGRLGSILGSSADSIGTVTYRQQLARRGFEQIVAQPLFGQPPKQLVANLPDLVQGEQIVDFVNTHLFIAMAAGVPLFFVWAIVWSLPVVQAWRLRQSRTGNHDLAQVPAAIIVPTMVALFATSLIDRNMVWPTIALALAGPCFALARRDRSVGTTVPARERLVWGMADLPDRHAAAASAATAPAVAAGARG